MNASIRHAATSATEDRVAARVEGACHTPLTPPPHFYLAIVARSFILITLPSHLFLSFFFVIVSNAFSPIFFLSLLDLLTDGSSEEFRYFFSGMLMMQDA